MNIENQSFQERQFLCWLSIVGETYVVYTLTFLQSYIQMLSTSVKNKNKCGIYQKMNNTVTINLKLSILYSTEIL